MKDIGNNLRKIRELKGLKQESVAKMLNMTMQGYGKIERNETDLTISKLNKLSEVLEVSPLDILTFEEKIPFINQQYNQNNEKVIICHTYHEKEKLEEKLKSLEQKIEQLEDKFGK